VKALLVNSDARIIAVRNALIAVPIVHCVLSRSNAAWA